MISRKKDIRVKVDRAAVDKLCWRHFHTVIYGCTNGSISAYFFVVARSYAYAVMWRLISLLIRSTIAFSSEQYGNILLCVVPTIFTNSSIIIGLRSGEQTTRPTFQAKWPGQNYSIGLTHTVKAINLELLSDFNHLI